MPPQPKNPAVRQRRNKSATRAILPAELSPRRRAPQLPKVKGRTWESITKRWWRDVWTSPMSGEYLKADEHALFILALLIDDFWKSPSVALAKEIRQEQQAFGLTPLDRRRLEWTIEQTEQAKDRGQQKRINSAIVINGDDPRSQLK